MTGPKLSKGASDRLLNLLYSTTLVEIANKTPLVTKFIHDHQPSSLNATQPPHKSILDDLMTYDWNQKPFVQAEVDLPKVPSTAIHSNILKFRCKNNFISGETFQNLYPIKRERKYQLSSQAEEKNGVKVDVVKARNPLDLQPTGVYYLLFKSFTHAAAYWLETLGKVTNGFDLRLEFTKLEKKI